MFHFYWEFASSCFISLTILLGFLFILLFVFALPVQELINLTFHVEIYFLTQIMSGKKRESNKEHDINHFFLCKAKKSVFIYIKKFNNLFLFHFFLFCSLSFFYFWCDVPLSSLLSFLSNIINIHFIWLLSFTLYAIVVTRQSNGGSFSFLRFIKICCNDFHKLKYLKYV